MVKIGTRVRINDSVTSMWKKYRGAEGIIVDVEEGAYFVKLDPFNTALFIRSELDVIEDNEEVEAITDTQAILLALNDIKEYLKQISNSIGGK